VTKGQKSLYCFQGDFTSDEAEFVYRAGNFFWCNDFVFNPITKQRVVGLMELFCAPNAVLGTSSASTVLENRRKAAANSGASGDLISLKRGGWVHHLSAPLSGEYIAWTNKIEMTFYRYCDSFAHRVAVRYQHLLAQREKRLRGDSFNAKKRSRCGVPKHFHQVCKESVVPQKARKTSSDASVIKGAPSIEVQHHTTVDIDLDLLEKIRSWIENRLFPAWRDGAFRSKGPTRKNASNPMSRNQSVGFGISKDNLMLLIEAGKENFVRSYEWVRTGRDL
jgi:hypothetical protein